MGLTLFEQQQVVEIYNKYGGNLSQIAKHLGFNYSDLLEVYNTPSVPVLSEPSSKQTPQGRSELEKYKVATIRTTATWPSTPEIQKARDEYDEGLVELATGRHGNYLTLYKFPRTTRAKRSPYFTEQEVV